MSKVRVAVLALVTALEAIGLLGGCAGTTEPVYVGPPPGQTHASTQRDPSLPVAIVHDVPPVGPGMPISRPGSGPIVTPQTFGDTPSPATIAPRTVAPADVDSTVESREPTPVGGVIVGAPTTGDTAASGTTTPAPPAPAPPATDGTTSPAPPEGTGATPPNTGPGTGTTPAPSAPAPTEPQGG